MHTQARVMEQIQDEVIGNDCDTKLIMLHIKYTTAWPRK